MRLRVCNLYSLNMELLSKLGIDWKLLLAQIINFVILLFVLRKFLYKPVIKMLEDREKKIETSLKQVETIEKNLFASEAEKAKIISESRNEAGKIIVEAKEMSEKLREELSNTAKLEAVAILEEGKKLLAQDREKMFKELKNEVAGIVKSAAEKLLQEKLDSETDKKMIDNSLKGLL